MEKVTDTIINVGVNDYDITLFEGQYMLEAGMAYNSYVILDDKVAVMDTVDIAVEEKWLENLEEALNLCEKNKWQKVILTHCSKELPIEDESKFLKVKSKDEILF